MAYRLASDGIRVNAIEPGHVWTELTQEAWPDFPDELRKTIVDEIPLGRMADPEEIAHAAIFLAALRNARQQRPNRAIPRAPRSACV